MNTANTTKRAAAITATIVTNELDGRPCALHLKFANGQELAITASQLSNHVMEYAMKNADFQEKVRHNQAQEKIDAAKAQAGGADSTSEIKNVKYLLDNKIAGTPAEAWKMVQTGKTPAGDKIVSDGMGGVLIANPDSGRVVKLDASGREKELRPGNSAQPAAIKAPSQGEVRDGYRFKGGNPKDKANWEKV